MNPVIGWAGKFLGGMIFENIIKFSIKKIKDAYYWDTLLQKVLNQLESGYKHLEHSEGDKLLVIDKKFFEDKIVQNQFTKNILIGQVNTDVLSECYKNLYGSEHLELFERNLKDAIQIFNDALQRDLSLAEQAAFEKMKNMMARIDQLEQINEVKFKEIDSELFQHGQQLQQLQQILEILDLAPPNPNNVAINQEFEEIRSEYKAQLDTVQSFIDTYQPDLAIGILVDLKTRIWGKATNEEKYRILTYFGIANLQIGNLEEAGEYLIEALPNNPENVKAISNAAIGYNIQGNRLKAGEMARRAISKEPNNPHANASLVYALTGEISYEEILVEFSLDVAKLSQVALALGLSAFRENKYDEAEKHFRIAVDTNEQIKPEPEGWLGDLLMHKMMSKGPLLQYGGFVNPYEEQAKEIITFYDLAWKKIIGREAQTNKITWLVNRGGAKAVLDDFEGAIKDTEYALDLLPNDTHIKKQLGILYFKNGELPRAANILREIMDEPEVPEARFWLALMLYIDNNFRKAKEVLESILLEVSSSLDDFILEKSKLYVEICCELGEIDELNELLNSISENYPDKPIDAILKSRVLRAQNKINAAKETALSGVSMVNKDTHITIRLWLADELFALEEYIETANLLDPIVDKNKDDIPTRQLVTSYYRGGVLQKALDICIEIRKNNGPSSYLTQVEVAIWEESENYSQVKDICLEYLEVFPNVLQMQLRLAVANLELEKSDEVDKFLVQDHDFSKLGVEGHKIFASLLLKQGKIEEAIKFLYIMRKRFFSNPIAHIAYCQPFLIREINIDKFLTADRVEVNTAVKIREKGSEERWLIIEDSLEADPSRNEYHISNSLVKALEGKAPGEKITHGYGPIEYEVEILEIKSKYLYVFHEILESFQHQFPETQGLYRIPIEFKKDADGQIIDINPIGKILETRQQHIQNAEAFYKQGKLAIGSLSIAVGENPIRVLGTLTLDPELGVVCSRGSFQERDEGKSSLKLTERIAIDIISLLTLHALDLADKFVEVFGQPLIARSSIDLLEELITELNISGGKDFMTLEKNQDRIQATLISSEIINSEIERFKTIIQWVNDNCEVRPLKSMLTISRDKIKEMRNVLGVSFADTILIAVEKDTILYTDDWWLRSAAKTVQGVDGVWTQIVLMVMLDMGQIGEQEYHQAIVKLIEMNYRYTSIQGETLVEAARISEWGVTGIFSKVASVLSIDQTSDEKSVIIVIADFVGRLWGEKLMLHQKERLLDIVLTSFLEGREKRKQIFNKLITEIQNRFVLWPTALTDLGNFLQSWLEIHIV